MNHDEVKQQFLTLYDEHADAIYRFCVIKTSNPELAHDLAQDVFMRFWDALQKKGTIKHAKAFLFTIARNAVIDWYRKRKSDSLDTMAEAGFDPSDNDQIHPERSAEYQRIYQLIGQLDPKYQDVLVLRYVEGLPPREIAQVLDESSNVISVRINRATKELQKLMKAYEQ